MYVLVVLVKFSHCHPRQVDFQWQAIQTVRSVVYYSTRTPKSANVEEAPARAPVILPHVCSFVFGTRFFQHREERSKWLAFGLAFLLWALFFACSLGCYIRVKKAEEKDKYQNKFI